MILQDKMKQIGIVTTLVLFFSLFIICYPADAAIGLTIVQGPYPPPVGTPAISTPFSINPGQYKLYIPITASEFPAPPATDSYYMYTTLDMWGLGCNIGTEMAQWSGVQNRFVFLDFGNPNRDSNGNYGTQLFNQSLITVDDINSSVYVFAQGFKYCLNNLGDYSSHLTIGVGTNSSGGSSLNLIATEHGKAWAQLIKAINTRLANDGISVNAIALGASNMEPGFNSYTITKKWVDGYQSVYGKFRLFNIGSADGCPLDYPYNVASGYYYPGSCNNNWNQDQIYDISWGAGTWFIPEIYESLHEAHSQQWYRIGLFASLSRSNRMTFQGSITQNGVCQQYIDRGDMNSWNLWCNQKDNSPQEGYSELYRWISYSDQYNHIENGMKWSTDIRENR